MCEGGEGTGDPQALPVVSGALEVGKGDGEPWRRALRMSFSIPSAAGPPSRT